MNSSTTDASLIDSLEQLCQERTIIQQEFLKAVIYYIKQCGINETSVNDIMLWRL